MEVLWFLPIAFWVVGLIVIAGGPYTGHKLGEKRKRLEKGAKEKKNRDAGESMYYAVEGRILGMIPWVSVRLVYIIAGMVIMALGFVALSFVI